MVNITKQQLLEIKIAESLVEAQDFDFIAMGRPEVQDVIAMPIIFYDPLWRNCLHNILMW